MFNLHGKVAIVTGGSRGIGRAGCEALAQQGAHVVVGYASNEGAANAAVAAIHEQGGKAEAAHLDVADPGVEKKVAALAKQLGRLDILVASAGIAIDGLLLRLKEEDLDRLFQVNVKGAILSARAALRPMMRARVGRVIFLSSVVGEMGNTGQTAYAASKAALLGVARSLAREYASRGITVNAITPGFIETDMTSSLTEEQRSFMLANIPTGRPGAPSDVGAAIAFLASDEASYVTGQVIRVNGGMYM